MKYTCISHCFISWIYYIKNTNDS